jgi:adenylate cyclase
MRLFENYLNGIKDVLEDKQEFPKELNRRSRVTDLLYKSNQAMMEGFSTRTFSEKPQMGNFEVTSKTIFTFDRAELEKYFGKNKASFSEISIGTHPDFKGLTFSQYEYHHCVSMFVDIKGSTKLSLKHSLEEVRLMKDTLLTLCIHVANFFGGHVHRLQGDAAFIQFVRKGLHPNDSIINALNAATVLCQFVSTDLSSLFEQKELNPIKIRVGIDYGPTDKVLWSHYGIPGCNELTTTSLHTDLAAKLQAKAANNSVRIGKNVVNALDLPVEFYSTATRRVDGKDEPDYYVLRTSDFTYNQYVFEWEKYLNSFDFIMKKSDGSMEIVSKPLEIRCTITSDDGSVNKNYYQNSHSIPKDYSLKYELIKNGSLFQKAPSEEIIWQVYNRGQAAKDKQDEQQHL